MNMLILLSVIALSSGENPAAGTESATPPQDQQVLSILQVAPVGQGSTTGEVGSHYVWPGRKMDCNEWAYNELVAHRLPIALKRAANALPGSSADTPTSPYDSARTMRYDIGSHSYVYSTPLSGTTHQVDIDYLQGIRDYCPVSKANDVRFVHAGHHYQIAGTCSRFSATEMFVLVRKIEDALHPHWLVVSLCGGSAPVDSGAQGTGITTFMGIEVWPPTPTSP